jgi:hypothetical protein
MDRWLVLKSADEPRKAVNRLRRNRHHETVRCTDEVIFPAPRRRAETKIRYSTTWLNEGSVMWWALVVGLVLGYPVVEMAEEWRLRRWARKDLAEMRRHAASGHRWDVTRGQWVG